MVNTDELALRIQSICAAPSDDTLNIRPLVPFIETFNVKQAINTSVPIMGVIFLHIRNTSEQGTNHLEGRIDHQ